MPSKLYDTVFGRCLLKILTTPAISKMAGAFMNSTLSKPYIKYFIKSNKIDLADYKIDNWQCFNEFFTRELKSGKRVIDNDENSFISPCDSYLSIYKISEDSTFKIKDSVYTIEELVNDKSIQNEYEGGLCLVFRLTPSDYHRYIYPDNGCKGKNYFIKGILHTVRPVAFNRYKVFKTNSREYTILKTNNFEDIVFIEVGAMLVGKIKNYHQEHNFKRGEEKGKFEFGGSTICMIVKKDIVEIEPRIIQALETQSEFKVKLGEKIGKKYNKYL